MIVMMNMNNNNSLLVSRDEDAHICGGDFERKSKLI